ncbi:hypothetical protein AAG570_007011 [Ranatra chinensis]|uniref:RNA-directed DNA polymerase n=1 Tax=Ranatra chinensis TaxID=642074 RepID=A0ABD0YVQ2_9HEMI
MLNSKRHQVVLETGTGDGVVTSHSRYARTETWTVTVGQNATDDDVITEMATFMLDDTTYYVYAERAPERERLERLYAAGRLGNTRWEGTLNRVRTVTDATEQVDIVKTYHVGKTNHRGVTETVKHLRRRYYWSAMPKVVAKIIAGCGICAAAMYERNPEQTPQMLTPTPERPLDVVEADVMFWAGLRVLTMMDRLTRFAFALVYKHIVSLVLTNKTAAEVCTGLLSFFGTVGLPGTLVVDRGREFHNARVKSLLEELRIRAHFTTPGHPRSHGTVERLHSTMAEHLRLLMLDRGLEGSEAVARAVLAYNQSVNVATDAVPLELMRTWQMPTGSPPPDVVLGRAGEVIRESKEKRVHRINDAKAYDRWDRIRVGDETWVKNWYRRRKEDRIIKQGAEAPAKTPHQKIVKLSSPVQHQDPRCAYCGQEKEQILSYSFPGLGLQRVVGHPGRCFLQSAKPHQGLVVGLIKNCLPHRQGRKNYTAHTTPSSSLSMVQYLDSTDVSFQLAKATGRSPKWSNCVSMPPRQPGWHQLSTRTVWWSPGTGGPALYKGALLANELDTTVQKVL